MVRRTERTGAHEWLAVRQGIGHRVDAGNVERFGEGKAGQDRRQGARQQGFSCPWRPSQKTIVRTCAGHFECPFGMFLPFHILKGNRIHKVRIFIKAQRIGIRCKHLLTVQMQHEAGQCINWENLYPLD